MNKDDTFKITRQDVWRELELLPAWQLRAPIVALRAEAPEPPQAVTATELTPVATSEKMPSSQDIVQELVALPIEITLSNDKNWAFACEISKPAGPMDIDLQSTLLNNILDALHIEKPTKSQNIVDIQANVIIAFGENVAQTLLKSQHKLEFLRGKLHACGDVKIIVSDDLAHLLANPLHKAKLWQDLCLARSYLESLQS